MTVEGENEVNEQPQQPARKRRRSPLSTARQSTKFHDDETLKEIRLYHSPTFIHAPKRIEGHATGKGPLCALCSEGLPEGVSGHHTITITVCSICNVPLCMIVRANASHSCFDQWHKRRDLRREAANRRQSLLAQSKKRRRVDEDGDENENDPNVVSQDH